MTLLQALQNTGMDLDQANAAIDDMKQKLEMGEDPAEVLLEYGLEEDYSIFLFD